MYVDGHPLTLDLDIDRIRGLIGRWRDTPEAAGVLISPSRPRGHT
jgi:hypothetical protein